MTWIQRIILPYVYPTKFSEATPNNKLPRHRTGWKQREPMQNKQAACTSGGIICTLHCTATAQTQTKFWAPPAWPQDASACRWINIREIHVLLLSDSIFLSSSSSSRISLSLSCVSNCVHAGTWQDWRTRGAGSAYLHLHVGRLHMHGDDIDWQLGIKLYS